ncbi:MAG: TonB-dependent receptor [Bacteroidetes bacterium]|nr:TonB-dependent receptor [Bacteroidota bacterium]
MRLLTLVILFARSISLFSQTISSRVDTASITTSTIVLKEVSVSAEKDNTFGIGRLNNVDGTAIYAGKKSEAIYLKDMQANLAANNSRQVFSKIAGINIFENDGSGTSIGVGGRGLNPNRISNFNTRQNGYDISADALGYPESYYTPPLEAIERIEILRGAASLQYGTQFGGMINYKFSEPDIAKKTSVNTRQTVGAYGFLNSFNQFTGSNAKLSFNTFYQYKHYAGWRPNSELQHHNAFCSVTYSVSKKITIKGEYTFLNYVSQQPGGLTDKQFLNDATQSNRARNWFKVNWNLYSITTNYLVSETAKLNFIFFVLHAKRDAVGSLERTDRMDDTTKNRNLLADKYSNFGSEIRYLKRYTFFNQQNNLLLGCRLYKGNTDRRQGDADKSPNASFHFLNPNDLENSSYVFPSANVAFFAENILQISQRWSVTPGIRWEYINTNANGYYRQINKDLAGNILLDIKTNETRSNKRNFVLVGIGSQYKFSKAVEAYANFSQNYRAINFNDMRVANPNFQVDPNLKDESGYTADGGLRGAFKNLLYFDVNGFVLNYNKRIGTVLAVDSFTYQIIRYRTNISKSNTFGIEAFAEIDWLKLIQKDAKHKVSTFLNASYIQAVYKSSKQAAFNNKKVEYVPNYIIRTGVTYGYKGFGLTAQYAHTAQQFSDATNAETTPSGIYGIIPSYAVVDFSTSFIYRKVGVYVGVNNATNSRYFTRRAEGYPGPGIIPADPVNWYVTLQYKI